MTKPREYFCNRCECDRCKAERRGAHADWPKISLPTSNEAKSVNIRADVLRSRIERTRRVVERLYRSYWVVERAEAKDDEAKEKKANRLFEIWRRTDRVNRLRQILEAELFQIQTSLHAIDPSAIRKLFGRLGLVPLMHPRIQELRDAHNALSLLDKELSAAEGDNPLDRVELRERVRRLREDAKRARVDLHPEVQTEKIRDQIYEEIAASIRPLLEIAPITYRGLISHPRIAERLTNAGIKVPDFPKDIIPREGETHEQKRERLLKTRTHELLEDSAMEFLAKRFSAEKAKRDAQPLVEEWESSWKIAPDLWKQAFLRLAVKHREPGFVIEEPHPSHEMVVVSDDEYRYGMGMLDLLSAIEGEKFKISDVAHRSKESASALINVLADQRVKELWEPARANGASNVKSLTVTFSSLKPKWADAMGRGKTIESQSFAAISELTWTWQSVLAVADAATGARTDR